MATHFTPKWKDEDGNVMILPARNTLFTDREEAHQWQIGQFIFFAPFGLRPDGILEMTEIDGNVDLPHIAGSLGKLGDCCIIAGPKGPEGSSSL